MMWLELPLGLGLCVLAAYFGAQADWSEGAESLTFGFAGITTATCGAAFMAHATWLIIARATP